MEIDNQKKTSDLIDFETKTNLFIIYRPAEDSRDIDAGGWRRGTHPCKRNLF